MNNEETGTCTISQAAAKLKVNRAIVWRWIRSGRLKRSHGSKRTPLVKVADIVDLAEDFEFAAWKKLTNEERREVLERKRTVEKVLRQRAAIARSWRKRRGTEPPRLTAAELVRLSRARDFWYGPGQERDTYWQLYGSID